MSLTPEPARFELPRAAPPERRTGVPVLAMLAPLVAAAGIWFITRSPYSLAFATLGPLVGVAGLVDRRRHARLDRRRDESRLRTALNSVGEEALEHAAVERERMLRLAPSLAETLRGDRARLWPSSVPESLPIRVGYAHLTSGIDLREERDSPLPSALAPALGELRARVERIPDAPLLVDAADGIGIVGGGAVVNAAVRAIALQLAARLSPAEWSLVAPESEPWARRLPHASSTGQSGVVRFESRDPVRSIVVGWASEAQDVPSGLASIVTVAGRQPARVESSDIGSTAGDSGGLASATQVAVDLLSSSDAVEAAARLCEAARQTSRMPPDAALPGRVPLTDLVALADQADRRERTVGELSAPIGVGVGGPVWLDLVSAGPHAIIGGTTGSGKSELLLAWVLMLAFRYPPERVVFLLVDFKGGAAFAPLAGLPHVVGIITDLDTATAARAVSSLRAELRRRERMLADTGLRSIDEVSDGTLPRLVVIVDEFAALVAEQPELHDTVADLAARGRSLGIHLVLCTQRPTGIVREGVLANATLRLSLRVNNRADSVALIGDPAAASIAVDRRGGAYLGGEGGATPVQIGIADADDVRSITERVLARDAGSPRPIPPWIDPLPAELGWSALAAAAIPGGRSAVFGLLDVPEEQTRRPAVYDPGVDGNLLLIGGRGSGKSFALAALATAVGPRARALPSSLPDLWTELELLAGDGPTTDILLIDDLDAVIEAADDETRMALAALFSRAARTVKTGGGAVIASASRIPVGASAMIALFESRLLLATPSREAHALAGGLGSEWRARRRPGSTIWHGHEAQIALAPTPLQARARAVHPVDLTAAGVTGIVSPRCEQHRAALLLRGVPTIGVEDAERSLTGSADSANTLDDTRPVIVVGEPEEWQAAWQLLEVVRRNGRLVIADATSAELRSLTRMRDAPPLNSAYHEGWLVQSRAVTRARLPWMAGAVP